MSNERSALRAFKTFRFSASEVICTHADQLLSGRAQTGNDQCDGEPQTAASGALRASYEYVNRTKR